MSKRSWIVMVLAVGAVALSGCVVVPEDPGYGYGDGYGGPPRGVYVAPPSVVVVPPPRHRHDYRHHRYYEGRRWR